MHDRRTNQYVDRRLSGRNGTVPGDASLPHPTLQNLSLEGQIEGDDELDGVVTVAYRAVGEKGRKTALPLRPRVRRNLF